MNEHMMKEKPILPLLTSMALPMVISMLVNSLYNIVDSFFIAQIDEQAMTALSFVYPVQNLINAIAIGFGVGINALVARYLGAENKAKANAAATYGMMLSILHGAIIMAVCIPGMPVFLRLFTSDQVVITYGVRYSRIVFSFSLILMIELSFEKIFQSVGRMKTSMVSLICGCVCNIILDPILIFGIGFFPRMGISGAALATGIGQVIGTAVYLAIYVIRPIPVRIDRSCITREKELPAQLYAIGIPAALNLALPSLLVSCLNGLLSAFSQSYVVILGIYYKLQTFLYLPANGIVQGMRPLVGYNYGAKEHGRVKKLFETTLCMNAAIMILGTIICLASSSSLIGLFTDNPETISAGSTALRIISAGFVVSAVSITCSGALEGLGKGTQSLVISLCRYVVIILPIAFVLCMFFGPAGIWNAFWITEVISAVVSLYVYRRTVTDK